MSKKLDPYREMLGKVPDKRIAELAKLDEAGVAAAREAAGIAPFEGGEAEKAAGAEKPPAKDKKAAGAEPKQAAPKGQADDDKAEAPQPAPRRRSSKPAGPGSVRVMKKARVTGPDGRPWRLGNRDVYSGERARYLWTHHRDHVERYPKG